VAASAHTATPALPAGVGPASRPLRRRLRRRHHIGARIGFLAPAVVVIAVFTFVPIALTFWISLHRWSMYTPLSEMPWVGVDNYLQVFSSPRHQRAALNTAVYVTASVALTLPIAFLLSLLLYFPRLRGQGVVRVMLFSTYILPTIAVAIIWSNLYASYGPVSGVLQTFGLHPPAWLNTPSTALLSLVVFNVWQMVGYYVILLVAGLTQIPEDVFEAARLDGAGFARQTWSVTLPMLRNTLFFVALMTVLNSVQVFEPVYLLTLGGPLNSTNVVSYDIQQTAFLDGLAGEASAMAFTLFLVLVLGGSGIAAGLRLRRGRG
jgi:ABC-type sugar transport system permease subunit